MAISKTVKAPDILYHYCGVNGFLGIIQSKVLWLSSASMLNDYMEQKWLLNKAVQQLRAFSKSTHQNLIKLLREVLKSEHSPYICCFSSAPDLLSQWRAYCDDGAGYAIGFSREEIESTIATYKKRLSLIPINYDEKSQEELIAPMVVDEMKRILERYKKDKSLNPKGEVVDLGTKIRNIAIGCKHPGFAEEMEWRIVYNDYLVEIMPWTLISKNYLSALSFRNSGCRLVPYFTMPFPIDAIKEIRLGPKNFARDNRDSLRSLFIANGFKYRKIKIINSDATYR